MFGFLKNVGKEILEEVADSGQDERNRPTNDPNQGYYGGGGQAGGGQDYYGGQQPPPPYQGQGGGYGGQGGYGGGQGGGYGGQGGYGGDQGGGYGGQGGYGGGQGGGQGGDMLSGLIGGFLGGGGGQQPQQHGGGGGGGGMNDLISGMASNYIGGMIGGQQKQQQRGNNNDWVADLTANVVKGIVSSNQRNAVNQGLAPRDDDNNDKDKNALVNSITSGIVQGLVRGQLASSNVTRDGVDPKADDVTVANIASSVVKGLVSDNDNSGNAAQNFRKGGVDEELLAGIAGSVLAGLTSNNQYNDNQHVAPPPPPRDSVVANVTTNVLKDILSGKCGNVAQVRKTGLTQDSVEAIAGNVAKGLFSETENGSPYRDMSEKENEEVVRCVTSKIVNALVSQEDGMRGDVSNDLLTKVAADAVRTYSSGGGQSGQQYQGQQGGQGGDLVSSVASSVIGNLFSGDGGESTKQKTGLDDRMVAGIVSHVVRGIRGRPQLPEGEADGVNDDVVATVTSSVIKEIVSQDTEGKILTSNDPGVNSSIVSNIASKIVQNIMTSDTPEAKDLKAAAAAAAAAAASTHAGGGAGGGGEDLPLEGKNKGLLEGLVSDVVGGLIGGGGGGGSAGGGQRNKDDVLSGIASNVIGGLVGGGGSGGGGGGGGKPSMSGGAIASNIIGKIVRGPQFSRKEDGEVVENLTQSQVDPSKHRIFPDPGSLISSFMSKGAYHLRNRLMGGGRARAQRVHPAHAVFKFGERGSGLRPRGDVQDFYSLRQNCLDSGELFEDPDFPAEDASIFFSRAPPKPFEWKRPTEISDDPCLFIDGASRFDVKQGELGDCWLLAAVANLTLNKRLFYQIVPSDQGFGDNYAGIFHFRFWQYGRWVDVVVDDRLPTFYGRLVFMHSEEKNEFWSALVEKAYAKLHGSYEALKGGTTCEAMEDFTGGVSEIYDLTKAPPNLFNIMLKAYERGSLMGCSLEPDPNEVEARCTNGLVRGHAYSLTRVKYCEIETPRVSGKIPLVRIRNPWGNEAEWLGAWSDKSQEWQFIPDEEKEEMGLTFEHDGEFWMSWKDFLTNFTMLEMTNLNPDSLEDEDMTGSVRHKWEMSVFEGAWIRGSTAGGCRNFLNTFWHNPQYRITLTEVDDDDDDNKCTVIVALMQKNRRSQRKLGLECLTIGFAIYHLRDPESAPRPLDANFFKYTASVARSPSFINMREVSCRFKLPPGTYCIVPSTFEPNEEGEFILRVFSEKSNEMEENDEEVGLGEVDERVQPEDEIQAAEADDRIRSFFQKVAGEDLEIDWKELQDVMNFALKREFTFDGFSKDVCRAMIAMMDVDRSGKLGLHEFLQLWTDIRVWKNVFRLYDKDSSGHLCSFELRQALNSAGYRLNNHVCNALMLRYGDEEGQIAFDDFIMCSVKLKTMMETFLEKDVEKNHTATFTLEEWVENTMYS